MKTLVLYHANCYDGFGAAWAAWSKFRDTAEYRAVKYGDPIPDDAWERSLFVLDFSYPREVLERRALDQSYCLGVTDLVMLDHHKTAEADLRGLPFCTFNLEKSGAMLAWEHFHPSDPIPTLIQYVQDRDLWQFALPFSREVSAWLRSWPFDFERWNMLAEDLERSESREDAFLAGTAILRFQTQMVSMMADNAWWQEICGHRVPVTNATVFFSETGEELCRRYPNAPFAAYYLDRADGKRQWGLRSRSGFDCSAIAKQFRGGGHPSAAGWIEPVPDRVIEI